MIPCQRLDRKEWMLQTRRWTLKMLTIRWSLYFELPRLLELHPKRLRYQQHLCTGSSSSTIQPMSHQYKLPPCSQSFWNMPAYSLQSSLCTLLQVDQPGSPCDILRRSTLRWPTRQMIRRIQGKREAWGRCEWPNWRYLCW